MAAVATIIPSISTVNLHFQASLKKGLGLDSTRRRRRLNSLVSITRACLRHRNAPLLESAAKHTIDFAFNDADIIEERTLISLIGHQRLQGEESIIQEKVRRRPSIGHAGPTGGDFPLITREGHNVLDVIYTSPILNLVEVANTLDNIDGVVDHGVISKIP
ncbi:probable ribose-5-phosphate isomerase 4, chloroplastic [Camellia sinensis]|uniref:probable ribose-5-phosphate isomerase 4, chloroplastic n=1 Tax=Camellia sinensis TaxID=4442 RepID=UPI001036824B|nr:probable ribose-5-phosphate isomerase 4, chloroplastic [Camellia sinensis]